MFSSSNNRSHYNRPHHFPRVWCVLCSVLRRDCICPSARSAWWWDGVSAQVVGAGDLEAGTRSRRTGLLSHTARPCRSGE